MLRLLLLSVTVHAIRTVSLGTAEFDREEAALSEAVRHILDNSKCSLGLGTDYPNLSQPIQNILIWHQNRYLPLVFHTTVPYTLDHTHHPWVWRPEQLMSFRTQPPELRSELWPGSECGFTLILAKNTSTVPELIMNTASSFMIRNLYDPMYIHVHDHHSHPEQLLLQDPLLGVTLKLLTQFNQSTNRLTLHNVCHFCESGQDSLNPPISTDFSHVNIFPNPPRNMNGKLMNIGLFENIYEDMEQARLRRDMGELLTVEEELYLFYEKLLNIMIVNKVPPLALSEVRSNGSLAGFSEAIWNRDIDVVGIIMYTDISVKTTILSFPVLHTCAGFASRTHRPDIKWYVIFQPYTIGVWMVLLASLVLSALSLNVLERSGVLHHMKRVLRELVEQPLDSSRDNAVMLFRACFFTFALVIICGYKTKLVSFITFPSPERLPINSSELITSKFTWGTIEAFFIGAKILLVNLNGTVYNTLLDKSHLITSVRQCIARTQREDFGCVITDYMYDRESGYFLDEKGNGRTIFWTEKAMCLFTGQGYSRDTTNFVNINRDLQHLVQASVFDHIMYDVDHRHFIRNYFMIRRKYGDFNSSGRLLNMEKLANIFYMWIVGVFVSFLRFVYEKVQFTCKKS